MDRNRAINLLKEIQIKIPSLDFNSVVLTESKPNCPFSSNYALHLMGLSEESKKEAIRISSDLGFAAKEEENELVIFSK